LPIAKSLPAPAELIDKPKRKCAFSVSYCLMKFRIIFLPSKKKGYSIFLITRAI
jgi:hypothetical protein